MNATIWRLDAAGAADGVGCSMSPASVLIHWNPERKRAGSETPGPQETSPLAHARGSIPDHPTPWSCTLLAIAHPSEIDRHPANASVPPQRRLSLPTSILLPALVNAHAHLDLTHIGPRPYDPQSGFIGWAMSTVRANRATTPEAALESLRQGIALSLAGGVVAVGDIVGALPPTTGDQPRSSSETDIRITLSQELRRAFNRKTSPERERVGSPDRQIGENLGTRRLRSGLVSEHFNSADSSPPSFEGRLEACPTGPPAFAEVFGMGPTRHRAIDDLTKLAAAGCSLQPHAPYSASREVYAHAASLCSPTNATNAPLRLCTHLAETLDERRFIEKGDGPFRALLERIGVWDDHADSEVGHGMHPIEHVLDAISRNRTRSVSDGLGDPVPLLAAHVNDCPQHLIPLLHKHNVSVAYCPRAHAYFHHPHTTGPHRYREMLEADINVCLATDSIINLPVDQSDRISPLDDARLLFHRDNVSSTQLIALATTHGGRAMGFDESQFSLRPGPIAGLIAVDVSGTSESATPQDRVMHSRAAPQLFRWDATATNESGQT